MEAFTHLHPRRVVRRADEITGVVHVHVEVAAVPALGRRIVHALGFELHDGLLASRRGHRGVGVAELEAPRHRHREGDRRHVEHDVVAMKEGPAVEVVLTEQAIRPPTSTAIVDNGPARHGIGPNTQSRRGRHRLDGRHIR